MVSPVSVTLTTRPSVQRDASPLSFALVTPKIDIGAVPGSPNPGNLTIPAPDSEITEITDANVDAQLGTIGLARSAYNYIESRSVARIFVLPFPVDVADAEAARLTKVANAINVFTQPRELEKLPNRSVDFVVLPRETGLGAASAANPVFAALAGVLGINHLGAIGLVDGGPLETSVLADSPPQADVITWRGNNANANILSVTNRGDVAGYEGMWGSVIAAGHWAYYTAQFGLSHPVANLRDQVLGVSNITPARDFDPDGASAATTLKDSPNFLTSLISWDGSPYLYGGQTGAASENDPLLDVANRLIANRIVKQGRRDLLPYVGRRGTERLLSSIQLQIQNDLAATYLAPGLVRSIDTQDVTLTGGRASARVDVGFFDIVDTVSLAVEVFVA